MNNNLARAATLFEARRLVTSRGEALLRWWFNELSSLVPKRLRQLAIGQRLIVVAEGEDVVVHVWTSRTEPQSLQRARANVAELQPAIRDLLRKQRSLWGEPAATMVVPPDRYLRRRISLPLAARAHLTDAIRYQLSRISPFQSCDVVFAWRVVSEQPDARTLVADVAIITNHEVEDLHNLAEAMGQRVDRLAFGNLDDVAHGQELAIKSPTARTPPRLRRLDYGLLTLATCLGVAGLALTHTNAIRQGEALETQIEKFKPLAEKAAKLSRQIEGETALATRVADEKTKSLRQIAVLNGLAEIFGDDVRLSEYRAAGSTVIVTGHAADATRLLSLIDTSKPFYGAKFVAPVMRDQANDLDRFSITFELRKGS